MEEAEADVRCGAVYLHVLPLNTIAIHFYEKHGFYRVCTIPDYYIIDNVRYDCYLYAKYLHGK
jgi:ribosomal protein S18 acetylase RimI-like enzyme